ncbi:MAG TPA: FkbM family methyltransferase [Longimicrobiales bacterium]|nr:FkbM family methyltransferase [Longimicrobiales bacterium]
MAIRSGPNRGMKWSLVALGRGYGSGSFARARLEALQAVVRPGDCFWDVGAHKGFVTLAAAGMVGPRGRVIAREPSETNLTFLRRHVGWNGITNVKVLPVALSDAPGTAAFGGRGSSIAFRLGHGPETVPVTTAEAIVDQGRAPRPSVMKLDVEGAEAAVLRGTGRFLGGDLAVLISTHGPELYEECRDLLRSRGFSIYDSREITERLRTGRPWTSDHDFLAIGPGRSVDSTRVRALPLIAGRRSVDTA